MKIQVFDPPMCCPTGVCGPSVDPELVRFAADLDWLESQGVEVERYNLAQQPAVFAGTPVVKETLAKDGTWLIVEPYANDRTEDNLNPVGRIFYAASAVICTPASLSQEVGLGLGAQAGEKRIRDVVMEAGFTRFRRAAETPFNLILEARP